MDSSGNAYICGDTDSPNFPTTSGAFQTSLGGSGAQNGFVTKLNATGSALVYSSYLGGSNSGGEEDRMRQSDTRESLSSGASGDPGDAAIAIAVDSSGNAYLTGYTGSSNFPITQGAFQTSLAGTVENAFVTKVNPTGSALIYSTYLGGSYEDYGVGVAVDSFGNAFVGGSTASTNFPTTSNAFQTSLGGEEAVNAFLVTLDATGSALVYSTYLGGSGYDYGMRIALDSSGNPYLTGYTSSSNFPTTSGAFQTSLGGSGATNAFVAKFSALTAPGVGFTPRGGLAFSTQAVGVSGEENVTLTNTGSASLTVTTVTLGGTNSGDFSESDDCVSSSPIAPAGTCTLDVTFTPAAVAQRRRR